MAGWPPLRMGTRETTWTRLGQGGVWDGCGLKRDGRLAVVDEDRWGFGRLHRPGVERVGENGIHRCLLEIM